MRIEGLLRKIDRNKVQNVFSLKSKAGAIIAEDDPIHVMNTVGLGHPHTKNGERVPNAIKLSDLNGF